MQEAAQRSVLIVEGNPDGHRLFYVSLLVTGATLAGWIVTVATTERAFSSAEWAAHLGGGDCCPTVSLLNDFRVENIHRLADELQVDHVVIPDGDSFIYELARGKRWSGPSTVTALAMREKGQPPALPAVRSLMTIGKHISFLLVNLRPKVEVRILKSGPWSGFSMLPVARDPVMLNHHPTERIQLPDVGGFWFGIVGSVGHRKNLPLVAEAIASLNRPDVGLVVAGQIDAGVLDLAGPQMRRIRDNGGRVNIVDRILSDSELDQLIIDLDCVVLAHSNDGPSGILGKAATAGTRIVAAGAATLRSDCRNLGEGAEWVHLRVQDLSAAFARTMYKTRPRPSHTAAPADFALDLLSHRS